MPGGGIKMQTLDQRILEEETKLKTLLNASAIIRIPQEQLVNWLKELRTLKKSKSDASWDRSPDRMGGQFSDEEIARSRGEMYL